MKRSPNNAISRRSIVQGVAAVPLVSGNILATFNTAWSQNAKLLTIAIGSDVGNLDPDKYTNWNDYWAYGNMFEGLYRPNAAGDLVPALAETHWASPDGLSHKFTLRAANFTTATLSPAMILSSVSPAVVIPRLKTSAQVC